MQDGNVPVAQPVMQAQPAYGQNPAYQQQPMMMAQPGQPMQQQPMVGGYAQPQQPMVMVQPGQPQVYVQQPMVGGQGPPSYPLHWPDHPIEVTCNDCGKTGITSVHESIGGLAWIIFFICFICGLWLGCCCVPFCIPACNDQEHRCSHCHHSVGFRRSLG